MVVKEEQSVQANPLTGNVLVHFDPTATDEQTLLAVVQTLKLGHQLAHSLAG
jgi:hypothetical protein